MQTEINIAMTMTNVTDVAALNPQWSVRMPRRTGPEPAPNVLRQPHNPAIGDCYDLVFGRGLKVIACI